MPLHGAKTNILVTEGSMRGRAPSGRPPLYSATKLKQETAPVYENEY